MKKTALVLSGGGSRGAYQAGVWQALREMGISIHMVVGTSVGAINGAAIAQNAFEETQELWRRLETAQVFDFSQALQTGGARYTSLKTLLNEKLHEDTIRASAIDFGLVTVEADPLEKFRGRHLWKENIPKGQLIDYILASASCFPAVTPYEIDGNAYIDGGFRDNLPVGMALDRGADTIIAVKLNAMGVIRQEDIDRAKAEGKELIIIESPWDLGNFLIFDQDNAKHLMRLGYLDGLKAFGAYEGSRFTFIRDEMDKRTLNTAEEAAEIFGLDPELIYSKKIFHERLADQINNVRRTKPSLKGLLELKGLRKDLKQLKSVGKSWSLEGLRQMNGIREDICQIRAQLLVTKTSSMVPSEARVLHFLEKEHLL
ncbi:MAG: patatin-like phospholipase family protein [Firmicutes bacterium]|nr:patatin-like phospholipase family protein [Bacillota bacterium]